MRLRPPSTLEKEQETYSRSASSRKDQTAEVRRALVAEGAGGVDEGTNTVRLERRADEGGTPRNGGTGGFPRADELLLGVGSLGALVGLAEEGAEHGELGGVVEDGAEGDSRGLDSGEIWEVSARCR